MALSPNRLQWPGAVTGVACSPMLAALLSAPAVSGWPAAAMTALLVCAGAFALAFLLTHFSKVRQRTIRWIAIAALALLAVLVLPNFLSFLAEQLRASLASAGLLPTYHTPILVVGVVVCLGLLVALVRRRMRVTSVVSAVTGITALLLMVLMLQAVAAIVMGGGQHKTNNTASTRRVAVTRVVWLVLDELDSSLLQRQRATLPNFGHLAEAALSAHSAFPPANFTHQSLPRLLVGRPLMSSEFSQTRVNLRESPETAWSSMAEDPQYVLNQMANAGYAVSVSGWHLPYCATVVRGVSCTDDAAFEVPGIYVNPLYWMYAKNVWTHAYFSFRLNRWEGTLQERQAQTFKEPRLLKVSANHESLKLLSDATEQQVLADSDLVFSHLPCPHLPRFDGRPAVGDNALIEAYSANLVTCDQSLGKLLGAIRKSAGQDPRPIAVIVTSDHWLRNLDCIEQGKLHCTALKRRTVPWMLAMIKDGQWVSTSRTTEHPFNTLSTKSIVVDLLNGTLKSEEDVFLAVGQLPNAPTLIEPF